MANNKTELSVNTEVIEKMAEIAAKEVDGVAGLSKKTIDLKGIVKSKNAFKGVKVENIGALAAAGADTFVAGSAIFGKKTPSGYKEVIAQMREAIDHDVEIVRRKEFREMNRDRG